MAITHIQSSRGVAKAAVLGDSVLGYAPVARPSKPKRGAEGEEGQEIQQPLMYQQYTATRQQNITHFYLSDGVDDPKFYTDLIHQIRTAQPQDIVYIHLNTPGGRLDTGIQIINAIADSAARIIGVLDSKAYSLGTLIFLACDEFVIHDNCLFMIHNYSGGMYGKGNEQQAELAATVKWFSKIADKYYYPFLSREEIGRVLRGEDFWMDSDEVKKRLKQMVKIREDEANGVKAKPARKNAKKTEEASKDGEGNGAEAAPTEAPTDDQVKTTLPTRRRKGQGLKNGILPPADAAAATKAKAASK
jgi:ATP-dependent protease ClpP protease subunit